MFQKDGQLAPDEARIAVAAELLRTARVSPETGYRELAEFTGEQCEDCGSVVVWRWARSTNAPARVGHWAAFEDLIGRTS